MSLIVSMFVITAAMYCVFLLIREYNELVFTRFRYRYFALRDELALLVVRGRLKEDSWEYQHLVETINFHISVVETMSILRIVELLIRYHTSPNEQGNVQLLSAKIDRPEVASLLVRYMETTAELLRRNSRSQIALIAIAKGLLAFFHSDARPRHEIVTNPHQALAQIETQKTQFHQRAAAA